MRAAACLAAAAAVAAYLWTRRAARGLREPALTRAADRLAVNVAACFAWLAVVALATAAHRCGLVFQLTALAVLGYLAMEARAVSVYVGPLCQYDGSELLSERTNQISTAAFAAGALLISAGSAVLLVAPLVFMALLLCVLSAVPSAAARKGLGSGATGDAVQRALVSFSAGILALAIAVCVDEKLA